MWFVYTWESEFIRIVIDIECGGFDPVEKSQLTADVLLSADTSSDHNIWYFVTIKDTVIS